MTEVGLRADLSTHDLGRLLVATPMIFDMLSTRDVRHLRRADTVLRSLVAEHPWSDAVTPIRSLTQWRSSFPSAKAALVDAVTLSKPQLARLSGLTSLGVLNFRRKGAPSDELPLAFVRSLPRLEVLHIAFRNGLRGTPFTLSPSAAVWRELGGLRELALELPRTHYPLDLLSRLGGLRKLSLAAELSPVPPPGTLVVTDAGLTRLPDLESLTLRGVHFARAFSGACFARLPHLTSMDLFCAALPVGATLPVQLVALAVAGQGPLANETLAPLVALKSLKVDTDARLLGSSGGLSSVAFQGMAWLESLDVSPSVFDSDRTIADVFAVLNGFGHVRRVAARLVAVGPSLSRLSQCPIDALDLQTGNTAVTPVAFAAAFPQLRSLRVRFVPEKSDQGGFAFFSAVKGLWVSVSVLLPLVGEVSVLGVPVSLFRYPEPRLSRLPCTAIPLYIFPS